MTQILKIVILTAGWATRMRPQTWSKPKPLVSVAGRTVLGHLLNQFESVPSGMEVEYVFIVGPYLGETQIPPYVKEHYPSLKAHYVLQPVMKGQSDALWLARQHLTGPVLICFSDTLLETDFSFLADEKADGVAWVKPVPDPRRFGVAEVDGEGWVTHLVEKPQIMDNNLAVVGCYYFKDAGNLLSAVEEQFRRGTSLKGEYFLTDTINIMIEGGLKMRTQTVEVWMDTGTIDATLETNRYLLSRLQVDMSTRWNVETCQRANVKLVLPVFVHASAEISNSVIGPYASIGAKCMITGSRVEDSIIEDGATVEAAALQGSFIGRQARVQGHSTDNPPLKLNIGDDSSVSLM
ncbi:MAG: sugar phosphate nucleotidyltransferase [Chloroflexi bacterium]|nr:sugar phosphate nucleotidyltransferase [Chloroflexota bacterium]